MKQLLLAALSLVVVTACTSSQVQAEYLVAVSWTGAIYRFDSPLGTPSLLQQTNYRFNALARDPSGKLFALAASRTYGQPDLITIDPQTGATTRLGQLQPTFPDIGNEGSLTFASDGTLYGTSTSIHSDGWHVQLVTIDIATLSMNYVSYLPARVQGLSTAADGTIFAATIQEADGRYGGIAVLDPGTGKLADLFVDDVGYHQALAFDSKGRLFVGGDGVMEYDMLTGENGPQGSAAGLKIRGIEFVIPEPSSLALGTFALLSLAARRRLK